MSYDPYKKQTIKETMKQIGRGEMYLPAIQRKYVWKDEQIYKLMDSIMLGYPIGTFLFWNVKKSTVYADGLSMYEFIKNYDERKGENTLVTGSFPNTGDSIIAVLDGQQRLTSLYIALQGSIKRTPKNKIKEPQEKELYFNLHSGLNSGQNTGDDEVTYEFLFLTADEAKELKDKNKSWCKVKEILKCENTHDVINIEKKNDWDNDPTARENLELLFDRLVKDETINYFEVKSEKMDDVLDIFVRVNSGGTVLSKNDLLFSTVVSNWDKGRKNFDELLSSINEIGNGFGFSNDFIMRTCLYLLDLNLSMKVASFKKENVDKIAGNWEKIAEAVTDTVNLLARFGFFEENIIALNAAMLIVYYRFHNNVEFNKTDPEIKEELKKYFVAAQLKQIFGASGNTVLKKIQDVLKDEKKKNNPFTLASLQNIDFNGKTLCFTDEEIKDLFETHEKNAYTFMILTLLYPHLNYTTCKFQQDHMHPFAGFEGDKLTGLTLSTGAKIDPEKIKDWQRRRNTLANLQLLKEGDNQSKKDMSLKDWLAADPRNVRNDDFLPFDADKNLDAYELSNFENFLEERKKKMFEALKKILPQNNTPGANTPAP